jgi:beta-lactamase class D
MKKLFGIFAVVIVSSFSFGQELPKGSVVRQLDLGKYFASLKGSFVLYDFKKDEYLQYNRETCGIRYSPCSTFKIPNSLIALETGVADDTSFVIRYDNTKHPIPPELLNEEPFKHWPQDQTMKSAIQYSVVWYYQEIAKMTGKARMQQYLDSLKYGNEDISSGIDHFWLGGSLKISADEQVEFTKKLVNDRLKGFSVSTQDRVKGIMLNETTDRYRLYGKSGGCEYAPDSTIGWYVGFVETQSNTYVFALNIFAKSFDELKEKRVEVTKKILHDIGIL